MEVARFVRQPAAQAVQYSHRRAPTRKPRLAAKRRPAELESPRPCGVLPGVRNAIEEGHVRQAIVDVAAGYRLAALDDAPEHPALRLLAVGRLRCKRAPGRGREPGLRGLAIVRGVDCRPAR